MMNDQNTCATCGGANCTCGAAILSAKYSAWIEVYVLRENDVLLGKCRTACEEMLGVFPELKLVRGHVYDAYWGKRGHFWLMMEDAKIIDPTRGQFPARSIQYEAWEPSVPVKVGKCMECGVEIFKCVATLDEKPPVESVCSEECQKRLLDYYNNMSEDK
jgi:hypothetical protein